jgi:hypothetical protein
VTPTRTSAPLAWQVWAVASAIAILHLLTNSRYGLHRDELQFLSDALHPAKGYVAYPPFTPLIERLALALFGLSLTGLRLFSVLAQCAAIVITGLMAGELEGGKLAQTLAALAAALSPLALFEGTEFQYTSFDYLWWTLTAFCVLRLLRSQNPRWFLAIGATLGLGLLTKYSIVFLVAGLLAGLLFTRERRHFTSRWFWAGSALAFFLFHPNLVWQIEHSFVSLDFLRHIHTRDVAQGRADNFLPGQFVLCANLFAAPLWLAGLIAFWRNRALRPLAWMYLVPLALFFFAKGRDYYLGGAYPPLIAMGAVSLARWPRTAVTLLCGIVLYGLAACAVTIPIASSGPLMEFALRHNGDLREEFGWNEIVREAARIRDSLPPDERAHLGILAANYGEQGAIELLGRPYNLPRPISGTNTAWFRGYPDPPPSTLIVLGLSRAAAERNFNSCRVAGRNGNSFDVDNEESRYHPDIFLCGPPRAGWPAFWKRIQDFG